MKPDKQPKIIQIIPAPENMNAIYEAEFQGEVEKIHSKIVCLALCDDGEVYPVSMDSEGMQYFPEQISNFKGIKY